MMRIEAQYHGTQGATVTLTLPFDMRQKSRFLSRLDDGTEVGVMLERGTVLRGGDKLLASDGRVVQVVAAAEELSVVASDDPLQLARAAYHLGNRHVQLQIRPGQLSYLHDHVLDDMLHGLGLPVRFELLPFEPESGAYGRNDATGAPAHDHGAHHHGHSHH